VSHPTAYLPYLDRFCSAVNVGFIFKPFAVAISVRRLRISRPGVREASSRKRWQATARPSVGARFLAGPVPSARSWEFSLRPVLPEFCDHSVYLPCTSLRRFYSFSPFCYFVESITYVESIPPRGSAPTLAVSNFEQARRRVGPKTRPPPNRVSS